MRDRRFASYRYSAFISYATGDDDAWNAWVSCFNDELNKTLGSRVRGIKVPQAHMSGDNPLIAGRLSDQLRANVDDSFAMFLFVHDNYLESRWCLKELEYFRELSGDDGFRERLYVIAMSKPAIDELTSRPDWKRLCPDDLLWIPFFREDRPGQPIDIYASNASNKRIVVANAFWELFVSVREDLAAKIREAVEQEPRAAAYPAAAVRSVVPPEDQALVRVYIEATRIRRSTGSRSASRSRRAGSR